VKEARARVDRDASGGKVSLGGMVGFVTLFGISLRNSIVLISHYEHLVHVDPMPWGFDTAVRGASERLIPSDSQPFQRRASA